MRRSRNFFEADDQLVVLGSRVSINILWLAGGDAPVATVSFSAAT